MVQSSGPAKGTAQAKSTKSPLRQQPRRSAGQSQYEYVFIELLLRIIAVGFVAFGVTVAVVLEIVNAFLPYSNPWLFRVTVVILSWIPVFIVWYVLRPKIETALNGMHGERAVADELNSLVAHGYQVLHDVPWDTQTSGQPPKGNIERPHWLLRLLSGRMIVVIPPAPNIDHVVIGPAGVFAIETKYRSKPSRGKTEIGFDGKYLSFNGRFETEEPIIQAKACAEDVRRYLKATTGMMYPVRPVVLCPGWYVLEQEPAFKAEVRSQNGVWVLNPGRLHLYLKTEEQSAHRSSPLLTQAEIYNAMDRIMRRGT